MVINGAQSRTKVTVDNGPSVNTLLGMRTSNVHRCFP